MAQDSGDNPLHMSALSTGLLAGSAVEAVRELPAPPTVPAQPNKKMGNALPLMYAGMVALQALDIVSTRKALNQPGAYETNPMFDMVGGSLAGTIALKAGATAGIIVLTERVRKTNKVAAVATMIALNSAYATIVAHNYAIAGHR